jgi:hypothetical protein
MKRKEREGYQVDYMLPDNKEYVHFKLKGSVMPYIYGQFHKMELQYNDNWLGYFQDQHGNQHSVYDNEVSEVTMWWRLHDKGLRKAVKQKFKPKKTKEVIKKLDTKHYQAESNKISETIDSKLIGWSGLCIFLLSFLMACNPPRQATVDTSNIVARDTISYGDDRFHEDEELVTIIYGFTAQGDTVELHRIQRKRWKGVKRWPNE